jgi:nitroreductase
VTALQPSLVGRRALRGLAERALDPAVVRRLFEAAVLAPSCANKQPWRFVAIQEPALLEQLRDTFTEGNYWAKKAPLIVAAWTHLDYDMRLPEGRDFALYDLGQAVMALQVQVEHEGLISHPFAGFDVVRASKLLELPEGAILPALISVSFAGSADHLSEKHRDGESAARSRKPLDEVVSFR